MEYTNEYKAYVDVIIRVDREGRKTPLYFFWEDGRRYRVDKVLEVLPRASQKAGGRGMRYTCIIQGQQRFLFNEDGRWFIEKEKAY